jgi:cytochrome c553
MQKITIFIILFLLSSLTSQSLSKSNLPGKDLFYHSKGKFGSCNYCHSLDGSSRRWNSETKSIDQEEGRKIPSLKGIGKRKEPEQIERSIQMMKKMFDFKLTDEQISQLVEYLGTL